MEEGQLHPVTLPSLDAFPESVQEQLRSQHSRLQTVADRPVPDPASLAEAYGLMGQLLMAYDLNHAAEPALLNAAHLLPEDFRWHYYLGYMYHEEGEIERAARHIERTLELQPDYTPARMGLAMIYRDLDRDSDAAALLHEILRTDPQNAFAHLLLGHLAVSRDPSAAIEHYKTVMRLQPEASVVRYPLAIAYRKLGDLDRSRELMTQRGSTPVQFRDPLFERLAQIRQGAGAEINRGNLAAEKGRFREAAALYEAAAEQDSTSVSAHLNLGIAAARLGEFERANEALERVLRLDPSNGHAHYTLGLIASLSGEPEKEEEALAHLQAALDADPGNSAAHGALANLLWRKRQCREAIGHYEEFLTATPGNVEARIKQAVCHAHLGEYARARALLEAGHEGSPDEPRLQNALARVLAASQDSSVRDGERALAMAEQLAATHRSAQTLESLAMAYAALGRFTEAIRYQEEVIRAAERGGVAAAMLDFLKSNLRRYKEGVPSATPWPPAVFDR